MTHRLFFNSLFFISSLFSIGCFYIQGYRKPIVQPLANDSLFIYVKTKANWNQFCQDLDRQKVLSDLALFIKFAKWKNLDKNLKPGRYKLSRGMKARDIVNLLKSGRQSPVRISFHYVRTPDEIAGRVARKIEADSIAISSLLRDTAWLRINLNVDTLALNGLFIPNTYEMYWNTSAEEFLLRMKHEYDKFWNNTRREKSSQLGLTPHQVATLASIVQAEQSKYKEEWPVIAGLYLNRLKKGMPLESDPTVKFAWNNPTIQRLYIHHLHIESPYNTYKNHGLPPGPILVPEPEAYDATLNPQTHSYLYMCAKDDLSGKHNFAQNLREHLKNARAYHKALNKRNIH